MHSLVGIYVRIRWSFSYLPDLLHETCSDIWCSSCIRTESTGCQVGDVLDANEYISQNSTHKMFFKWFYIQCSCKVPECWYSWNFTEDRYLKILQLFFGSINHIFKIVINSWCMMWSSADVVLSVSRVLVSHFTTSRGCWRQYSFIDFLMQPCPLQIYSRYVWQQYRLKWVIL